MPSGKEPGTGREFVESLRELVRFNIDGRDGLRHAAEHVEGAALAKLFRELCEERAAQAGELQAFIARNGGEARVTGHASAAFHRLWLDLRASLTGGDARVVLAEIERGEDLLFAAYEEALRSHPEGDIAEILRRHAAAIGAARGRIRKVKDSAGM